MTHTRETSGLRRWLWIAAACLLLIALWLVLQWKNPTSPAPQPELSAAVDHADQGDATTPAPASTAPASTDENAGTAAKSLESGLVFGQVLFAETREPAALARVFLNGAPDRQNNRQVKDLATESDSEGRFQFDAVALGRYRLFAESNAWLSFENRKAVPLLDVTETELERGPITLLLYEVPILEVLVVSAADQKPIAGAAITNPWFKGVTFLTDAAGLVSLPLTNQIWSVHVSAEGYASSSRAVYLNAKGTTRLRVALEPGGGIFGVVSDSSGAPIKDVRIQQHYSQAFQRADTDENGYFEIKGLPLDTKINTTFFHSEYDAVFKEISIPSLKNNLELNVTMEKNDSGKQEAFTVSGVVVDESEQPIEGAEVSFGPTSYIGRNSTTLSNEEGRFTLKAQRLQYATSDKNLLTMVSGYAPNLSKIKQEDTEGLIIKLSLGDWIKGRLVDSWETPVPNALVVMAMEGQYFRLGGPFEVFTDENGAFEMDSLPKKPLFSFYKQGYSGVDRNELEVNRDDVVVVMPGLGSIHGRVLDAETLEPVPAFNIKMFQGGYPHQILPQGLSRQSGSSGIDFFDKEGHFLIEELGDGNKVRLQIEAESYNPKEVKEVTVVADQETEPLEVLLSKKGLLVQGVVVDPNMNPWPNATVYLLLLHEQARSFYFNRWNDLLEDSPRMATRKYQATTGPDGVFRFENVPTGYPIDLAVMGEGLGRRWVSNLEGTPDEERSNLVVKVDVAAEVYGKVNPEVYPDAGYVRLNSRDNEDLHLRTPIKQGAYVFDQLPQNVFELNLEFLKPTSTGYPAISKGPFTINAGDALEVDFGYETYTVSGNVFINDRPMVNGMVMLKTNKRSSLGVQPLNTDSEGFFSFINVENGEYTLIASNRAAMEPEALREYLSSHRNSEGVIVDGADVHRQFHFQLLGSLRGRLTPAPDDLVNLRLDPLRDDSTLAGVVPSRTTGMVPGGAFEFREIAPGSYSLSMERRYLGQRKDTVILPTLFMPEDGSDVDLGDIPLDDSGSLRVTVEGALPQGRLGMQVYVTQLLADGGVGAPIASAHEFSEKNTMLIEDIPTGPVRCMLQMNSRALKVDPPHQDLEIILDHIQDLRFTARMVTYASLQTNPSAIRFLRVALSRGDDGPRIDFVNIALDRTRTPEDILLSGGGYFIGNYAEVQNFPEGAWLLEAVDESGRTWSRVVEAKAGEQIRLTASFE